MKQARSPQRIQDLAWRPPRTYRSRLEAWPTHYPEWWEPPPRNHMASWLWKLTLFFVGLAGIVMLF